MKKTKLKNICAFALVLGLGATTLIGCGSSSSSVKQELTYNLAAEVKTVDPTLNTAVDGSTVIANAFEGLCRTDENEKAIPGVAKSWDISDDNLTYTFHLRDDAKWSDGQEVKAGDFVYAWKRILNPATAAEYAYQLYYIEGGEAYNTGKGSADDVKVKAIDDKTLEVKLAKPTAYFLELTSQGMFMPEREDIVEADPNNWSTSADTYVSNGPFKLQEYAMKDSYTFVKNDNYYDKDKVKLDKLTFKMMTDETSAYASLKNGEIQGVDAVPLAEIESGKQEGLVGIYDNLGTYFYCINVGNNADKMDPKVKEVLSNKDVRKAFNLALDRRKIVDEVAKGGQVPSFSFVPKGIKKADGSDFADKEYWDGEKFDLDGAKALLAKAGYPNGEGLPTFTLTYNSNEGNKKLAEAVQQMWAQAGIKVTLQNEEWSVFQDTRRSGNYEIARHGWSADYIDPMTFLDMWVTNGGNNDAGFSNKEYDELLDKAQKETDAKTREGYLRQAEDILMEEMPVIPVYNYTSVKGFAKNVKGVRLSSLAQIYFDRAYLEAE